ncbi:hypothetical protein D9M71_548170 [compost metagenome]
MEEERRAGDQAMQDRRKGADSAKQDMADVADFYSGIMSQARQPLVVCIGTGQRCVSVLKYAIYPRNSLGVDRA